MRQLPLLLPSSAHRQPELATLAILDAALSASESALLLACPEIHCGIIERASRASTVARANAVIVQLRRLATSIAAYRDALDREARRAHRDRRFF